MKNNLKTLYSIIILLFILIQGCYKAPLEQPYRIKEIHNLILQANKAYERKETEKAKSLYNEALKKSRLIQDNHATAIILISLSRLHSSEGHPEKSIEIIDTVIELSKRASLPENIIDEIYFEKARTGLLLKENVEELLRKLSLSKFIHIRIKSLNLLARVKLKQEKPEEAEKLLYEALEINQEINKIEKANSLRLLGDIYINKDKKKAESYLLKALEIDKELAIPEKIALDLENLGILYKKIGDKKKAKDYFMRALEIWREMGKKELEMKMKEELIHLE